MNDLFTNIIYVFGLIYSPTQCTHTKYSFYILFLIILSLFKNNELYRMYKPSYTILQIPLHMKLVHLLILVHYISYNFTVGHYITDYTVILNLIIVTI